MHTLSGLIDSVKTGLEVLYNIASTDNDIVFNHTRPDFEGDFTLLVFPFAGKANLSPEELGRQLGVWLCEHSTEVESYNVVKGFLNLILKDKFWIARLRGIAENGSYGTFPSNGQKVMVEFSSPNTNKPLHLGHIRNILLGWSCSRILEANGYEVIKTQVINDRGIAICKSMLAWQKFGEGRTPESAGIKSDHFVGEYYVLFEQKFQEEYNQWQKSTQAEVLFNSRDDVQISKEQFFKNFKNTYFNEHSALGAEARRMLLDWESGDKETLNLWQRLNNWVYQGFNITYDKLGVSFDKLYFESDTYLLGKKAVDYGLSKGVFYKLEDGSVWIDLEDAGMDKKLVLRSDGTAVYMTQDIGTAQKRYEDFGINAMVYTVADEQDYHFKVLFEILKRLGEPYAEHLYHLSYGMVDLPTGKMKSREGTVVDADDLIDEVTAEAAAAAADRGELAHLSETEQRKIISTVALGALKYFIIRVQPRKRMTFDPKESVDMQGNTGPYIQNAFVRIQSVLRKSGTSGDSGYNDYCPVDTEKFLIRTLMEYPDVVIKSGGTYDPSLLANYCYSLAKLFHKFYHDIRIINAESDTARSFRMQLCKSVAHVLSGGMDLLGINMPDRM